MRRPRPARHPVGTFLAPVCLTILALGCAACAPFDSGAASRHPGVTAPGAAGGAARLPVAGSFLYQGLDPRAGDQTVLLRVAVHAVRRTGEGTVLDWSLTPLAEAGHTRGEEIWLGRTHDLDSPDTGEAVALVDTARGAVYRPLVAAGGGTPRVLARGTVGSAGLRLGRTSLLQVAFGPLPADLDTVEVAFNGGYTVPEVPVTAQGQVPSGSAVPELTTVPATARPVATTAPFRYPASTGGGVAARGQRMTISVERVIVTAGGTTLWWTVHALDRGAGLGSGGSPVADSRLHPLGTGLGSWVADGPALVPVLRQNIGDTSIPPLRASYTTLAAHTAGPSGEHWQECLCASFRTRGAVLLAPGDSLGLATTYPALPEDTQSVSVTFPDSGLPALADLRTGAPEAGTSGPPVSWPIGTWHLDSGQGAAPFEVGQWPTPVPDKESFALFTAPSPDDLLLDEGMSPVHSQSNGTRTTITLDSDSLFVPGTAVLRPAARVQVRQVAARMGLVVASGSSVTVTGYQSADGQGTPDDQRDLSDARARAVQGDLLGGVHVGVHWIVEGRGPADPLVPEDSPGHRALNDRVTVRFQR